MRRIELQKLQVRRYVRLEQLEWLAANKHKHVKFGEARVKLRVAQYHQRRPPRFCSFIVARNSGIDERTHDGRSLVEHFAVDIQRGEISPAFLGIHPDPLAPDLMYEFKRAVLVHEEMDFLSVQRHEDPEVFEELSVLLSC